MDEKITELQFIRGLLDQARKRLDAFDSEVASTMLGEYLQYVEDHQKSVKRLEARKKQVFGELNKALGMFRLEMGQDVVSVGEFRVTVGGKNLFFKVVLDGREVVSTTYSVVDADRFHEEKYDPIFWDVCREMLNLIHTYYVKARNDPTVSHGAARLLQIKQKLFELARTFANKK